MTAVVISETALIEGVAAGAILAVLLALAAGARRLQHHMALVHDFMGEISKVLDVATNSTDNYRLQLSEIDQRIEMMSNTISKIQTIVDRELLPNGGDSIRDRIIKIEGRLDEQTQARSKL